VAGIAGAELSHGTLHGFQIHGNLLPSGSASPSPGKSVLRGNPLTPGSCSDSQSQQVDGISFPVRHLSPSGSGP
jgi:hypothetical protein